MPKTKTNLITRQIIAFLHDNECFAWRAQSTGVYDRTHGVFRTAPKVGVSDILALGPVYNSRFIAVEVKVGSDKLRDEQIGFLKNIEHFGGWTFVVGSLEDFKQQWFDKTTGVIHN